VVDDVRGDVMSALCNTTTWQYAVIDLRTEPPREHLVIAYPDEKTLRDLIAAASIVALGYDSRQEAIADFDLSVPKTGGSPQRLRPVLVDTTRKSLADSRASKRRRADWHGLARTRTIFNQIVHHCAAAAVILLYSRNVLSVIVRAFSAF
jgi:hypothetical protein